MDCPTCHHDSTSHNTGTCNVLQSSSLTRGLEDFRAQGGCGCTALPFDATCITCGEPFVCGLDHEPHACYRCYQIAKHAADASSFGPLIDALQKRNIPVTESDIWNTGGNVMCLGLHVTEDPSGPYVMWSDDAEYIGFGVYPDDEHTGLFVSPLGADFGTDNERPEGSYSWAYADNAERAADLAVRAIPQVVRWLDTVQITRTTKDFSFGPHELREIARPYPPLVVTDAEVNDFEAD